MTSRYISCFLITITLVLVSILILGSGKLGYISKLMLVNIANGSYIDEDENQSSLIGRISSIVKPGVNKPVNIKQRPDNDNGSTHKFCPWIPKQLNSLVRPESIFKAYANNKSEPYRRLLPGGEYRPPNCTARESVAIVVAYRDRPDHLKKFLQYMHPFLQKQQLHYMIFIVELTKPTTFNRGLLLNVGFVKAAETRNFSCYVFHDVDLLPTNENNFYRCNNTIRHLSTANSKFRYSLPYGGYCGGVLAFPPKPFRQANGYSNVYFGWGGEDDDIAARIQWAKYTVTRPSDRIGRYDALPHTADKGNPLNPRRFDLVSKASLRFATDGLNSLEFKLIKEEQRQTCTWILAEVDRAKLEKTIPRV